MSGWSVFPDVAFHGGSLWDCYREDPKVAGRLVVRRDGVEVWTTGLPKDSPCFPRLHAWAGVLWIGYHDGREGHLQLLDPFGPDRVLSPCESNDPLCFGSRWVAWQGAVLDGWPIRRMDLETGTIVQAGFGQGTGLSRILADGTVRLVDEDRDVIPGVSRPCWASDFIVAETPDPQNRGIRWKLDTGQTGMLWPTIPSVTPRCAVDPTQDRVAVVTWGGQTNTRLWVGTRTELPATVAAPVDPIVNIGRPAWMGFFIFGPSSVPVPANCQLPVVQGAPWLNLVSAGRVIARYVSGVPDSDVDALERSIVAAKADGSGLPVIAYWTRQAQAIRVPKGADWYGVEAYRGKNESVPAFEAALGAAAVRCPKVVWIPQVYTSNANNTTDLTSIPPVIARLSRYMSNVVGILGFSGAGRATGYQDHPEVWPLWQEVFAGIPSAPVIVSGPAPAPTPIPVPLPQPTPQPEPVPAPRLEDAMPLLTDAQYEEFLTAAADVAAPLLSRVMGQPVSAEEANQGCREIGDKILFPDRLGFARTPRNPTAVELVLGAAFRSGLQVSDPDMITLYADCDAVQVRLRR